MPIEIPGDIQLPPSEHNVEKQGQELGAAFIRTCVAYDVDGEVAAVAAATLVAYVVASARANGRDPNAEFEKIGEGARRLAPQLAEKMGIL